MRDTILKAAAAVLLTATSAGAAPVAVFVSNTIKVDKDDARAFEAVCQAQFAKIQGVTVVDQAQIDAAVAKDARPEAVAHEVGAGGVVSLQLIRLPEGSQSSRIILNASADGWGSPPSETEITLGSLSEAPEVCERLARAVSKHVSLDQTQTKDNVISQETSSKPRTHADKYVGVKTGLGIPVGVGSYQPMGSVAGEVIFEGERSFVELGVGLLIPSMSGDATGYGGLTSELGFSYYLLNTNSSPFIGVGVEPRLLLSGSVLNFAPYAQMGWMSSRQSSNRFLVEVRAAQNIMAVTTPATNNGPGMPTELTVQGGMTF